MPALERPRWLAILDRFSVLGCGLAWIAVFLHIVPAYTGRGAGAALVIGALAGYTLADLLSGTVHWLADRYFDPKTPILGPALIAPFREHHADPLAMTRHDFFEISGNNGLTTVPLAFGLLVLPAPMGWTMQIFAATVSALALSIIATNQFHCWAHVAHPPNGVRHLQEWGLILSPERHAEHHDGTHDGCYCVTSGWLNPLLDRIRFFARLEERIASVAGRPRRNA